MVVDRIGWQIGKNYCGRGVDSLECSDQPPRPPPSVRHCGFYRYQRKWQALVDRIGVGLMDSSKLELYFLWSPRFLHNYCANWFKLRTIHGGWAASTSTPPLLRIMGPIIPEPAGLATIPTIPVNYSESACQTPWFWYTCVHVE